MTAQNDFKKLVRERQLKTGESYTAARMHVARARDALLGRAPDADAPKLRMRGEAVVLRVNARSARIRLLGEDREITFRGPQATELLPGQIATIVFAKRWTWRDDSYASGEVESARIDVARLGLKPLPLEGGELVRLRKGVDPFEKTDPYAPLWRKLTAKPRPSYEMDPIAWGLFPGEEAEDNLTCDAAELRERGEDSKARELLMQTLHRDLRCVDAHAALGNLELDASPSRALGHYEIGIKVAELSLPPGFDGVLPWERLYNRPFLRCLHGYGLSLWRLGRFEDAERVFFRMLALNPSDHQSARTCLWDVQARRDWEALYGLEKARQH